MIDSKFLDSSAWLSYFYANKDEIMKIVESNILILTSTLCLFEVKRKLMKQNINFISKMDFIMKRSIIIYPSIVICQKSAEISIQNNLGAIDSIIYTTSSMSDSELITGDNDFRGLEKVRII